MGQGSTECGLGLLFCFALFLFLRHKVHFLWGVALRYEHLRTEGRKKLLKVLAALNLCKLLMLDPGPELWFHNESQKQWHSQMVVDSNFLGNYWSVSIAALLLAPNGSDTQVASLEEEKTCPFSWHYSLNRHCIPMSESSSWAYSRTQSRNPAPKAGEAAFKFSY